ncbi:MAG: DNA-formamidopyrimidine glycosylase family protein [Actinomycetota bacterium]|nr:DNA-formamidopyrimidine glycosylase family protein [Actinomycetota bacterium]
MDDYVLDGVSVQKLSSHITGHRFVSTSRHGKYMFAENDRGIFLVMHFGMTGRLEYKHERKAPDYAKVIFNFKNGSLYYISTRKLGKLTITPDRARFIRNKRLGPDALGISWSSFEQLFTGRKSKVKTTLLNQSLVAGIGNIYADEICFHARVSPRENLKNLGTGRIRRLYDCMLYVLNTAVEVDAEYRRLPDNWLIGRRKRESICPECGNFIQNIRIAGRGTYLCPRCQSG